MLQADLHLTPEGKNYERIGYSPFQLERHLRTNVAKEIEREVERQGQGWLPFKVGMFGGSVDRFRQAKQAYERLLAGMLWPEPTQG
jgi:hypothetical protein